MRGGTTRTQGAEANQGNKRRPWMRLEVSGGGILVIGGVIVAAALAAYRGHANKQRNRRKTTAGSGYEQYHKEKEEEVKDGSIINGYGEITADDCLVEIKKDESMTEIDGKLCLCQSRTEEREEWKEEAETAVGLKAYERVEQQDDRQEGGKEKVSACAVDEEMKKGKEYDACNGVGEGEVDQITVSGHSQEDQLSDEMMFVHARNQILILVEDDTKQVDEGEQIESNTKLVANDDVLELKESCGKEAEPVVEELGKGENEANEGEGEPSFNKVALKDEVEAGEWDCREEGCNSKEEEEPATEVYQEETEQRAEKEEEEEEGACNGRDEEYDNKEVDEQATESYEEETEPLVKEELVHVEPSVITEEVQEDECDAKEEPATESCEEETEPLVKEELVHKEPAVNTEEVQEDERDTKEEPATESCEDETGSSDGSGASSTENEDAVWPAEVLEHDVTKAGQLTTTMLNRQMMMMTMEKKTGKAFFIYMNHSLLVLAIALALALLSFNLSHLTVP